MGCLLKGISIILLASLAITLLPYLIIGGLLFLGFRYFPRQSATFLGVIVIVSIIAAIISALLPLFMGIALIGFCIYITKMYWKPNYLDSIQNNIIQSKLMPESGNKQKRQPVVDLKALGSTIYYDVKELFVPKDETSLLDYDVNKQEDKAFTIAKPIGNNLMKNNDDKSMFHKIDLQAEDGNKEDSPIPKMAIRPFKRETKKQDFPKNGFVQLAHKYVNQTFETAKHEPFNLDRPTYHAMSKGQGKWYFYWRDQLRKGKYLQTDLSYIVLHVYEVIHLVGFNNPRTAFTHLSNVWRYYRNQHPRLDDFLVDWLADFLIVYTNQDVIKWYSYVIRQGASLTNPDLYIEAWLFDHQDDISKIPDTILNRISDYPYESSDFYRQSLEKDAIRRKLKQGLNLVNDFFKAHYRQPIFTYYREVKTIYPLERGPFEGAIYEGDNAIIKIADTSRWVQSINLRRTVALILKYAENRLREQDNYSNLLDDSNIPLQWASILDKAFPTIGELEIADVIPETEVIVSQAELERVLEPEPETQLGIDYSRVAAIMAEADRLRDSLINSDDDEESVQRDVVLDVVAPPIDQPLSLETSHREAFSTDFQDVIQIIDRHSDLHNIWELLSRKNWSVPILDVKKVMASTRFLSSLVDDLNDDALNLLGDNLILIEGDSLTVNEEYIDELKRFFNYSPDIENSIYEPPHQQLTSAIPLSFDTNRPIDTPSHLLTDLKEVAEIIQNHPDTGRLLQGLRANNWCLPVKVAESQFLDGQFLSGIVDDLNSDALDLLDDNLLFDEDQMLIVNEEYQDELEYLLAQTLIQVEVDMNSAGIFIEEKIETNPYSTLPVKLSVFAEMLKDQHWHALEIILSSDNVTRDLNHLAKRYYSTYDVIIDDINSSAIDCWGYSLIALTNPPTIDSDEIEDTQLLINWASDNQIF